jgi:hypothetical protein
MASFSTLPDEVILHIIEALFQKVKINVTEPREDSLKLKEPHRINSLRVTGVDHKLRSFALAFLEKNVEICLTGPVRWGINQYRKFLKQAPALTYVVNMIISPSHVHLHILPESGPPRTDMALLSATKFLRLKKIIVKSEGHDTHGLIDKRDDWIREERYKQETEFVVSMIGMSATWSQKAFMRGTPCGNFQRSLEFTFTRMGKLVSSLAISCSMCSSC